MRGGGILSLALHEISMGIDGKEPAEELGCAGAWQR